MKALIVNGSPRKNANTAQLLKQVAAGADSAGAEAEVTHLKGLRFTGCVSCFECKRIGGPSYGRCVLKDDLRPLLDQAHDADVLVLGTPFYICAETAFMRAFQERLWFQYLLYSTVKPPLSPRKKATALVYTMNVRQDEIARYGKNVIIDKAKMLMEHQFAPCDILLSCDTLQFDDYSKYDTDMWDVDAKQKRHAEVFPLELKKAFDLGVKLVS